MDKDGYVVQEIRCCMNCDHLIIDCSFDDGVSYDCYRDDHAQDVEPLGICYKWRYISEGDNE